MTFTAEQEAHIERLIERHVSRQLAALKLAGRVSPEELRARRGLDVVGLARMPRVDESTIRAWESGACIHPRKGSVCRAAKALSVEFETLWTAIHWRMSIAKIGAELNGVAQRIPA